VIAPVSSRPDSSHSGQETRKGKGMTGRTSELYPSVVLRRVGHLHAHYASTTHSSAREITLALLQTPPFFFGKLRSLA
jgi:hypothetical protein